MLQTIFLQNSYKSSYKPSKITTLIFTIIKAENILLVGVLRHYAEEFFTTYLITRVQLNRHEYKGDVIKTRGICILNVKNHTNLSNPMQQQVRTPEIGRCCACSNTPILLRKFLLQDLNKQIVL